MSLSISCTSLWWSSKPSIYVQKSRGQHKMRLQSLQVRTINTSGHAVLAQARVRHTAVGSKHRAPSYANPYASPYLQVILIERIIRVHDEKLPAVAAAHSPPARASLIPSPIQVLRVALCAVASLLSPPAPREREAPLDLQLDDSLAHGALGSGPLVPEQGQSFDKAKVRQDIGRGMHGVPFVGILRTKNE